MFQLVIVLYSFMVLASTKECKPGVDCESRCCTTLGDDVLCRERCLGLSCELDVHCDGDCCVNSTCSSCLLKWTGTQNPKTTDQGKKYEPTQTKMVGSHNKTRSVEPTKISTSLLKRISQRPLGAKTGDETATSAKINRLETPMRTSDNQDCFHPSTLCSSSGCCIDGRCVDSSFCVPFKAARGGRGGGGRGGGSRGGGSRGTSFRGGGVGGSGSSSATRTESILFIVGNILGAVLIVFGPLCCIACYKSCKSKCCK